MKLKSTLVVALSVGLLGTAFANQVTLVNGSTSAKPLQLTYKLAYKNPHSKTVFSKAKQVTVKNSKVIQVPLRGYKLAGVVPVAINGHKIPKSVTRFAAPKHCSVATSKKQPKGQMVIAEQLTSKKHGSLTCEVTQGVHSS